jgi:hypothetical protein
MFYAWYLVHFVVIWYILCFWYIFSGLWVKLAYVGTPLIFHLKYILCASKTWNPILRLLSLQLQANVVPTYVVDIFQEENICLLKNAVG